MEDIATAFVMLVGLLFATACFALALREGCVDG